MKYISIDIETTGLSPTNNQVLEVGAVLGDTHDPTIIGEFQVIMLHSTLIGDPFAINMNQELIRIISGQRDRQELTSEEASLFTGFIVPADFCRFFAIWAYDLNNLSKDSGILFGGKNVASFDLPFLDELGFGRTIKRKHRVLDPAMLYIEPSDVVPPDLDTCIRRSGLDIPTGKRHRALVDAEIVNRLIYSGLGR
jgi:DNA polymerase III epsilon subunit-like protein